MRLLLSMCVAAFLCSCHNSVLVFTAEPTCHYQKLGIVTGSDLFRNYDDMLEELKKHAADMGADAVIVDLPLNRPFSETPGSLVGKAIRFDGDCQE